MATFNAVDLCNGLKPRFGAPGRRTAVAQKRGCGNRAENGRTAEWVKDEWRFPISVLLFPKENKTCKLYKSVGSLFIFAGHPEKLQDTH